MSFEYKFVTVHDFKTNFSRYLKELEQGHYRAIVIRRYKTRIAMLHAFSTFSGAAKNVDQLNQHS